MPKMLIFTSEKVGCPVLLVVIKFLLLLRVTVGVLQASLALEEELSLKAQLQKLLTVAKNLFTHLGEDNIVDGEGGDIR